MMYFRRYTIIRQLAKLILTDTRCNARESKSGTNHTCGMETESGKSSALYMPLRILPDLRESAGIRKTPHVAETHNIN
jgi:hypothetical protein